MTPLWARMLVFKAWQNEKITKDCAQYFDTLLNEHSYFYSGETYREYQSIDGVLQSINSSYCKGYNFGNLSNLIYYIRKISYDSGRPRTAGTPFNSTKIYLFEILGCEISDIGRRIISYLENNSQINEHELKLVQEYYDRLCATGCLQYVPTKDDINHLLEIANTNLSESKKNTTINTED